ncbi:MAG: hypothetical protein NC489_44495 [Ruminococcus flavefaciens]|nr:hypothetical protein [Ruminococcus flavefaciens]
MLRRMLRANPVFTFLFLFSFTLTFCIAYYGMSLKGQLEAVENTAEEMDYGYRGSFMVDEPEGPAGIAMPGLGTGIICYMVGIGDGDIVDWKSVYVVAEMNDPMLEPMAEGDGFVPGKEYGMPQCVCGRAWEKYIREEGGRKLLSVRGWDCEVAGILEPNGGADSDWRLFLYGPSMQLEFTEELFGMEFSFLVDYRTEQAGSADIEKFEEWVFESFPKGEGPLFYPDMETVDGSINGDFKSIMSVYQKFFMFLMIFCFFDCAYLTYVWCTQRLRENMVKRVFGFSMGWIWLEGVQETVAYEAVSLLLASALCIIVEAIRGNMEGFLLTWKHGAGLMGMTIFLFTVPLSAINILYLRKIKPADTLKAAE